MDMVHDKLLTPEECCLHIVDPQQSLMQHIYESERVTSVIKLMFESARILKLSIIANTQYERGLGPYVEELDRLMVDLPKIDKTEFCSCANTKTQKAIDQLPKSVHTVLLVGVETHICIYQTAKGYLEKGFTPWIVADGVSSRTKANYLFGLRRLEQMGAIVGPAEMIIYELLAKAGTESFKAVLPHVLGCNID